MLSYREDQPLFRRVLPRRVDLTLSACFLHPHRATGSLGLLLPAFALFGCGGDADPSSGPRVAGAPLGVEGAHEHGVVRAGFAVDEARLTLDLEVPADAVFGFEHAPETDEERQTVRDALSRLQENAGALVSLEPDLMCEVDAIEMLEAPDADGHEDEPGHDDHDHEAAGVEHSEVRLAVAWRCGTTPEGTPATLQLRDVLPDAELVDLTVITSQGQAGARVAADAGFSF